MGTSIRFRAMQAILYVCPICSERFVGGEAGNDEQSDKWINMHGDWHSQGKDVAPSTAARQLYGFVPVGL